MTSAPHCVVAGEGEVLLFLHGVGGGADSWKPQLAHFSKRFCAAAWDMPGYGDSPRAGEMTFPMLADSLCALLDDRGWDRVHLVGHSIGGMVAQEFAVRRQDRLRSLTLSATSPAFGRPDGDFQRKFVEDRLAPIEAGATMAELANDLVATMMSSDADAEGRRLAFDCMTRVPADTYRAAVGCIVTFDRRVALPALRAPVLIVAGETDTNAPAPMMHKMAGRISGSRYVCLPGIGHLANLENPGAFNAALDDFLDSLHT